MDLAAADMKVAAVEPAAIQDLAVMEVCVLAIPVQAPAVADLAELVPTEALVAVVVALVCLVQDQMAHLETILVPLLA